MPNQSQLIFTRSNVLGSVHARFHCCDKAVSFLLTRYPYYKAMGHLPEDQSKFFAAQIVLAFEVRQFEF